MKNFFIIAGEASGDLLGSKLIAELKLQNPQANFVGVGGKLMKEQGLESIFPAEDLSVMGFLEIVPHLPKLLRRINQTANEIINRQPDCVITIDSPDFCFRVVRKIQDQKNIKKAHLIAPSVWAYREGRAAKIAKIYDLLLAILPFEPPYFEKHGLKTVFIGHPITENAPNLANKLTINLAFRAAKKIATDDLLIFVTPGSRNGEVKRIFPEFIGAINDLAQERSDLKVLIPLVDKTRELVISMSKGLKVPVFFIEKNEKEEALFASDYALAKSGTNSLEISLYEIPLLIAYKINAFTHFILKRMIKIKFANLINLVMNEEVIPEMLQKKCSKFELLKRFKYLLSDKNSAKLQIEKSKIGLKIMGLGFAENPSRKAAQEIIKL